MSDASTPPAATGPVAVTPQMDQICDRFEDACQASQRPRIEDYLVETPEPERSMLLRELVKIELTYRRRAGEQPGPDDYRQRFPSLDVAALLTTEDERPQAQAPGLAAYRLTAEIARGGMGCVFAAHDPTLDREVAIKTLLAGADVRRFVTEAKVTARLAHPGIPPVHALGTLADGTPYLAMKLIRGRTLAELLKERPSPLHELPRFVQIFEQIAQAVGFAHAQGILHRDLKPLNVMVGAFGEVQVMDWGLAKELPSRERERPEERPEGDSVTQTAAGTIMGTPGYMAPEQARGEDVDARADVFALGALLAVILTGQPAFVGTSSREVIDRAARADLTDARERLTASGADSELIALALACLAADVAQRPAEGRAVAALVAAYRAGVEARLRQAETERAAARVREAEQRKRRRTVQGAGGVIAVVLLAGLGVSLWQMVRAIEARDYETKARQQAFAALRSMTEEVVERKFAQGAVLTEDDRAFLRGVIAQYDVFAAIKGEDADSRAVRAEGRHRVGLMRFNLGELKEAEQDYDQAVSTYQQLAAEFPSRPEFRRELAKSRSNLGNLLRATGRLKEAEQDFDQALSIGVLLAAEFSSRPELRADLARNHVCRGNLLRATGRLKDAEQDYDQAVSIQKQLMADFPSGPEFCRELALSHNSRGGLLIDMGRPKEAEQDFEQALSLYKQLTADFSSRPEFRRDLAWSHHNWGSLLSGTGRWTEAEKHYDQALSIRRQLAADFPSRPEFREELAHSHDDRGILLATTGRRKEGEKDFDQALTITKQLAADFPSRLEFRQGLARGHNNRGALLLDTGRFTEAEQDFEQALSIGRRLAAEFPNQPRLRNELAGTCVNLALVHLPQGKWAAAQRVLLEGRPHHLAALKANPSNPIYRQSYRGHLSALTQLHAGLLEQEDALRTAETCRDLGWDAPADAYDAACGLSLCVRAVAQHVKLDTKQRQEAAQFYGDAAMRLLRVAVSRGYQNVAHMKKDTDLDPLRQRQDFQRFIAELEGNGK